MDELKKKYEILPGTKTPDLSEIKEAASNFENNGILDIVVNPRVVNIESSNKDTTNLASIEALKELGNTVADEEERAQLESKLKMQKVLSSARKPESISEISNTLNIDPERRKEIDEEIKQRELEREEEEKRNKALQEERLIIQQKAVLELQQKKEEELSKKQAKERNKALERQKKNKKSSEDTISSESSSLSKEDEYKEWVKAKREEAMKASQNKNSSPEDDFSEFL